MDFLEPRPEIAPAELRAMAMVAGLAESGLARPQRAMLDAVQRIVLGTELDVDAAKPITPEQLARHPIDAPQARQLIRLMVAISLADGPPSRQQVASISSFAAGLDVDEPAIGVNRHLANGRLLRFRIAFLRRSHLRVYLRNTRRLLGGVWPMIQAVLVSRGVRAENSAQVARYRALGDLPEDTLGHAFHEHWVREGLKFPGEKGGFPEGALFHDFAHVLAGYDTSPEGEMQAAAFQAGFTRAADDFFTALFAIVIHTAGVNLAPFPMPVLRGRIGQGSLAVDVLRAWRRGAAMQVDLGADWDFWQYVELPLEAVRERLGVCPLHAVPGGSQGA